MGLDSCETDCAVHADVAKSNEDALGDYVEGESYNKPAGDGSEAMEEVYEETYGDGTIPDCTPELEGEEPTFEDIDGDGDGSITEDELTAFGARMCVSKEMCIQMFSIADISPMDEKLSPEEYAAAGEESAAEVAMDEGVDNVTEGDQEYHETKDPGFEEFDGNGDDIIDEIEASKAIELELSRRLPGKSEEQVKEMADELAEKFVAGVDKGGDGKISREEWNRAVSGPPEDMGTELAEAAEAADAGAADPDALPAAEHSEDGRGKGKGKGAPAAGSPAAMFLRARRLARAQVRPKVGDAVLRALLPPRPRRSAAPAAAPRARHRRSLFGTRRGRGHGGVRLQRAARPVAEHRISGKAKGARRERTRRERKRRHHRA